MRVFTNRLRQAACIAIGALTLALGQSTDAQACHGGGRWMGGGYMGNGYMGGMGQSYGAAQPYGMPGGYGGQGSSSAGWQNYSSPQEAVTSSVNASVSNPATVLAHTDDLKLTSKQMQLLEKMVNSGKQHAAVILTNAQRRQLAEILGPVRKSGSH